MFNNSNDFTIEKGVFNNAQGSLNQVIYISGDGSHDLQSRFAQNFSNEPYYSNQHRQNRRKTSQGTCRWILDNSAFLQWCEHDSKANGSPLLWIHGPPGSGKSLLCSQIIESLSNAPSMPTIAYHFCDFARPYKEIEVLSMLACQILEAGGVNQAALIGLLPVATNLQIKTPEYVHKVIEHIATLPHGPLMYFLLDGLDEDLGETQAQSNDGIWPVLDFLKQLTLRIPGRVRLLISSQQRNKIRERVPVDCHEIDITPFARGDILFYLEQTIPQIEGPSESAKQRIFQMLRARANCSFIWARLMVDELMQGSSSSAIMELIDAGVLPTLDVHYRNIFLRYPRHLRPLASMVFSLVLYAKRPLRFCELWEAVSCLSSKDVPVMDPDDKLYKARLHEVMQPLIELVPMNPTRGQIERDETQFTCHLIHSTLNDFLHRRMLLCRTESSGSQQSMSTHTWACSPTATNIFVCPDLPAKACLNYLSQFRFSQPLHKEHSQWRDFTGSPVEDNRFLIYAAKYWDNHFDAITDPSVQKLLAPVIVAFVKSQNFWTMVQVQTLWVQSHFSTFRTDKESPAANATYLRRMLPKWFIATDDGHEISLQYKSFLRQWRYFLCCGWCSGVANSELSPYAGQLDRIWTGALGKQNFLNKHGSSLTSFPIRSDPCSQDRIFLFDWVSPKGTRVITLQISLANLPSTLPASSRPSVETTTQYATLDCECQTWGLASGNSPYLIVTQTIQIPARHCHFHLYVPNPTHPYFRSEKPPLAAFASNGQALRIGSQIFKRNPDGHFVSIANFDKAKYYEEVSRSGTLVVLASRTKFSKKEVNDFNRLRGSSTNLRLDSLADNDNDDNDDHWTEVRSNNSGSCSDLSYHSGSDSGTGDGNSFSSHSKTNRKERHRTRNILGSITRRISHWRSSDDSESEDEEPLPGHHFSENNEGRDNLYEDLYGRSSSHSTPRATISIYRTSVFGKPKVIFKNSFPTAFKIHGSPPVFHPEKELVAWPLRNGIVLFVDCRRRKSSSLKLRPSIFPGHIPVQCSLRFSRCNQFMHVAALEAWRTELTLRSINSPGPNTNPITLSIAVSTYRIDLRNPTEFAPTLIHHVILDLKQVKGIHSRRLPFNLTWSPDHVYVTSSWKILQVWSIPLFSYTPVGPGGDRRLDEDVDNNHPLPVVAPKNVVFMPKTCTHRPVHFFPNEEDPRGPSKIVVGCEASTPPDSQSGGLTFEDPILCYVDEEKDLGGWVDSRTRPMEAENDEIGILESRLMEAFDSNDDLEPTARRDSSGIVGLSALVSAGKLGIMKHQLRRPNFALSCQTIDAHALKNATRSSSSASAISNCSCLHTSQYTAQGFPSSSFITPTFVAIMYDPGTSNILVTARNDYASTEQPPPLAALPARTYRDSSASQRSFLADLSRCLADVVSQLTPTQEEMAVKEDVRKLLEQLIRTVEPESRLLSFGSPANGFGLCDYGLSLCCMIDSNDITPVGDLVVIVGDLLKRETNFHIMTSPRSRNPIIELILDPMPAQIPYRIMCDISFKNTLALEETRLLRSYAMIDPSRVQTLVVFVKFWSKVRKINSPSQGTLSSYGYVLLVLYFLVHVKNPPVLPNLYQAHQEEANSTSSEIRYSDNIEVLQQQWASGNTEPVAELLIDFFAFYAHKFRYETEVVSIRSGRLGGTFKGWQAANTRGEGSSREYQDLLFIEDPFEIQNNVARSVTNDGQETILGEFRRGYEILQQSSGWIISKVTMNPGTALWRWPEVTGKATDVLTELCQERQVPPGPQTRGARSTYRLGTDIQQINSQGPEAIEHATSNTAMFENSHDFTIARGVFNSTQGNFSQTNYFEGNRESDPHDFQSRLSQNFGNEPSYSVQHRENLRKTERGTCRWFLEDPTFLQWCNPTSHRSPVLWIHGSPGSGKSIIFSQIISHLSSTLSKPTLAYHFCNFARPYKEVEILSMLACQLLETCTNRAILERMLSATTALQVKNPEHLCKLIERIISMSHSAIVYFLLDGLDEDIGSTRAQWGDAMRSVLDFLQQLAVSFPSRVRLLVSSQQRETIREKLLSGYEEINITPFAREDILLYLSQAIPKIKGPTELDRHSILQGLQDKAQCSFLWARLIVDELMHRSSLNSMKEFLGAGFPQSLEDYYEGTFNRYPQHLCPLASTVFSLVLYAKRPLRFCELREAVWCISSKNRDTLDPDDRPYEAHLREVFQPFIELLPMNPTRDQVEDDETQFTCHLIHNTLNSFLLKHRMVPRRSDMSPHEVHVCPEIPANACLDYLLQKRYADLLKTEALQWYDSSGAPIEDSGFLKYAAKYWDKHFDGITEPETQKALIPIMVAFLKSPNFWTVIQIQALWVQSHFSTFHTDQEGKTSNVKYLRRMLPKWFIASDDGLEISQQYKNFLRQWRYFLCCGWCSGAVNSELSPYAGQLDRIWTGAFGEHHFLSRRRSSLTSFPIRSDTRSQDNLLDRIFSIEWVSSKGARVITLQISLTDLPSTLPENGHSLEAIAQYATLDCRCQTWGLTSGNPPCLLDTQRIQVLAGHCDFNLYILDPTQRYLPFKKPPLAAFASDGQALRIGSQIFKRRHDRSFVSIASFDKAKYYEEFSRSGTFVVLTSRTKISKGVNDSGSLRGGSINWRMDSVADDDDDDDDHWAEVGSNNSGSCSDLSYHSGSDSGMVDGDSFSSHPKTNRKERRRKRNPFRSVTRRISHWRSSDSPESEDEEPLARRHLSENDEERDNLYGDLYGKSPSHSTTRATISIYRTGVFGKPKLIYKDSFPTMFKIHGSPPVFRPHKELVAWPLGDGKILLVDCRRKKSSTLKLRPSIFPGHIPVQCSLKFSGCNQFMHVAALEAQRKWPMPRGSDELGGSEPNTSAITLSIAVSTYRIDPRDLIESPPTLIHHVILDLKQVKGIHSRQLPFNLTWSADHVYVTSSWKILQVWRIPLFSYTPVGLGGDRRLDEDVDNNKPLPVTAPKNVVFMPKTCTHRPVHFFPNEEDPRGLSKIVVGCEASMPPDSQSGKLTFEDPILCYVDGEKDLGGWVDSRTRPMASENDEIGILENRLMEAFDSDDELELEPYYS